MNEVNFVKRQNCLTLKVIEGHIISIYVSNLLFFRYIFSLKFNLETSFKENIMKTCLVLCYDIKETKILIKRRFTLKVIEGQNDVTIIF